VLQDWSAFAVKRNHKMLKAHSHAVVTAFRPGLQGTPASCAVLLRHESKFG